MDNAFMSVNHQSEEFFFILPNLLLELTCFLPASSGHLTELHFHTGFIII